MATFTYQAGGRSSGRPPRPVAREALDRLLDGLIDKGRYALRQLQPQAAAPGTEVRALLEAGYLRLTPGGELELTPAAVRVSEEVMLAELLRASGPSLTGRHPRAGAGIGAEAGDESRPHRPGDPLDHLDLSGTLGNALARGLPLHLRDEDVVVRPAASAGRCGTILLLDQSGSMARHGKFSAARRAALALRAMVRRRFPGDELFTAGFASRAERLDGRALLEATPRDVGLYDPRQREYRLPLDAAQVPEHFTNLQAALRLARRVLRGKGYLARQALLITDGEPTAHLEGDQLVLSYPPTEETLRGTMEEARRCAAEGITLSVLGLVGASSPPNLRLFVERLARAGRGVALCCPLRGLGPELIDRFLRARSVAG